MEIAGFVYKSLPFWPIGSQRESDSTLSTLSAPSYLGDSRSHGRDRPSYARRDGRTFTNTDGLALRAPDRRASIRLDEEA
jgi:hypothetical protein